MDLGALIVGRAPQRIAGSGLGLDQRLQQSIVYNLSTHDQYGDNNLGMRSSKNKPLTKKEREEKRKKHKEKKAEK
jgi:hypothetical protein